MGCSSSSVANPAVEPRFEADYTRGHSLKDALTKRWITFVKARFIVDIARRSGSGRVMRHQDVPAAQFSCPSDLLRLLSDQDSIPKIMVLSYRWLTRGDPDPDGHHVRIVSRALKARMEADTDSSQDECFALFWDFMSLPQHKRSTDEEVRFQNGLKNMNVMYAHMNTIVLLQTKMPGNVEEKYDGSGWCTFERSVSGILKNAVCQLDIGDVAVGDNWAQIQEKGASHRMPPLSPQQFEERLKSKKFTGHGDKDEVIELYKATYESATSSAKKLNFEKSAHGKAWGNSQAAELAEVLKDFKRVDFVDLSYHMINEEGLEALAGACAQMPCLRTVCFTRSCGVSSVTAKSIFTNAGAKVKVVLT